MPPEPSLAPSPPRSPLVVAGPDSDPPGDAVWWRSVLAAVADPLVIADESGQVIEFNDAFSDLFGWTLRDGPFNRPYPWWPDRASADLAEQEDLGPDPHPDAPGDASADPAVRPEVTLLTREGQRRWVTVQVRRVQGPDRQRAEVVVTSLRDVTREHLARERRAAAVRLSSEFATAADLSQVLGAAVAGFAELFDGDSTVRASTGAEGHVFTASGPVERAGVDAQVWTALGQPVHSGSGLGADGADQVRGLLLAPDLPESECRVWVQFHQSRRVTDDERIIGGVLVQAFSMAVERVAATTESTDREAHLTKAMESHRVVGQAVGILIERHRITPAEAFIRLRAASQQRNTKLHEIAARVVETGADPDEAE